MKLLLTSGGLTNPTIHNALLEMLGKPIAESTALIIPTAAYSHPWAGPVAAWRTISGNDPSPFANLGWKSVGVLELTALPSLKKELWQPWIKNVDVLLVGGGDALYLCRWLQESGVVDLFPSLREMVWIGISAGSMVMTPRIGEEFAIGKVPAGGDKTLGIVDFSIFPHLDYPGFSENTTAHAEKWAARIGVPSYAIDDDTAIKVVDGKVEVISEGHWKQFAPEGTA